MERSPVKLMPSADERPKGKNFKFMFFVTWVFCDKRVAVQSLRKDENKWLLAQFIRGWFLWIYEIGAKVV